MKPPLVVIAGATATGKSAIALDLAGRCNGIIINADASQIYADLRILSARPTIAEERQVPHRLFGHVDGAVTGSAADWAAEAAAAVAEAHAAGQLPVLVGGTGMYLRTLLNGIAPVPAIATEVRDAVRAIAPDTLHDLLKQEDPDGAARLHPNDRQRLARALEVVRGTGRTLADWQAAESGGIAGEVTLHGYVADVARDLLYQRIDRRFDSMLAEGAVDEVVVLRARYLDPALPVMKAIGVPPLLDHLAGRCELPTAAATAKQDSRNFAKRQLTWFRNQVPEWKRIASAAEIDVF